jgi:ABC-type phosphate transport system auxiliary subunit
MADSVSVRAIGAELSELATRIAAMDAKLDTLLTKVEGIRLVLRDTANGPSGTLYTMVASIKSLVEDD